ncbi:sulfhydryl oxidase 1-like [Drosophila bipectinata]|uniref:sulfhydryl oxidase 1-like n=1 Tax=Drosophila bipectinata TaxID=42026 RepID=UPI001C890110|nr:sulfhydryl oxidase 1-like [Drosophila bipectinata]
MAIHILMHSEIPKIKIIKGKAYESLMNFLAVLVHLSPMKLERMHWFDKLKDILTNSKGVMFGIEFQDLVYAHELAVGKLIGAVDFVGCRRSAAYPRGFSCALWHLFHYLTVQASLVKPQTYKPGYVLNIIASFIRYFFPSCPECSRTFQEIAEARKVHEVRDYDEEILWMWEAHNEINRHLAGGSLEDPLFPKKQFPTAKSCPDCKTNHVWDRKKVLNHLKDIYAMEKLSKLNLIHRPPVPPQKEGRKNPPKGDKDHEEDHKEPKEGHNEHEDGNKKHEGSHKNSESGERDGYTPLPTPPTTVAPVENEDYVNKAISERLISGPLKIYRADMEQAIDKLLHIELPKVQRPTSFGN